MAKLSVKFMVMTILAVVLATGLLGKKSVLVSAQTACQVSLQDLISECSVYVAVIGPKLRPSNKCCSVVNRIDVPCACQYVSKEVESVVSMKKVVYVAEFCGVKLAHGMKCGSYTVPGSK